MNLKFPQLGATLCAVAVLMTAGESHAVLINVTVDGSGALLNAPTGIASSSQYDALHGLSPSNNNPDRNAAFLNALVANYNGAINPDLPLPDLDVALNQNSVSGTTYTTVAGYDYVVFHYGAGKAGGQGVSPGGWWQAYFLGGEGGHNLSVPTLGSDDVGGFSSARYFNGTGNSVPEGGSSLAVLGLGMVALGAARRFVKKD